MMSKRLETCGDCQFFRKDYGSPNGDCFGMPPSIWPSGFQQSNRPKVKETRPACSLFKLLPDGVATLERGKIRSDTPADAIIDRRKEVNSAKNKNEK
jgi:hypothetical protein